MAIRGNKSTRFNDISLESQSLVDKAYQAIHDAILYGNIKPGAQLRQAELAEELGISARTVREALSRLAAEGLVDHEPHHGVRVATFTITDQEELYQMRATIEGKACEVAATCLTPTDLKRLKELVHLATPGTNVDYKRYNHEFHWIIIRASGKRQYIRILENIWRTMFTYYYEYETPEITYQDAQQMDVKAHEAILAALEERDGEQARKLLEEHIMATFQYQAVQMREYIQRSGLLPMTSHSTE
jgi:DNA-binding GntR family transcriptional regulator